MQVKLDEEKQEVVNRLRQTFSFVEGHFSVPPSWENSYLFKARGTTFIYMVSPVGCFWYDTEELKRKPTPNSRNAKWVLKLSNYFIEKDGNWPPFYSTMDLLERIDNEPLKEAIVFNIDVFY